ncbi:MAG: M20/M25/M40 family metallo-hydrolase [Chthonomonadales bacterium]
MAALAQADPAIVTKIVEEGKNNSKFMENLDFLATRIGPRLTGSPKLDRAYVWAQKKFKEFGCKNVHLEEWGTFPVGFDRGKKQVGHMIAPDKVEFVYTTPSWTPGTNGSVKGPAIIEPNNMEEFEKVKGQLKNAWLIVKGRGLNRRSEEAMALQKAIREAGAAGRISGSSNDLVITFGAWNIKNEDLPKDTVVIVRKQDMDAITSRMEAGQKVELEFNIEQKFVAGPIKCYNVIAEIPGTEKPDEVVIVSGHLDSWDGPGSQGAQDNGTGSMVAMESARILNKVGAKPKRTIRFILWSGEEQGLFGSQAYVKAHKDEMSKISCVFVDDGGTNYEGGLTGNEAMKPLLEMAIRPAQDAFPDMPMSIGTSPRIPRGGGSDHASFNQVGVPGFYWRPTGKSDYNHVHHTQYDRMDTVVKEYRIQASTNSAAASFIVACAPMMMPRDIPTTPPAPSLR